jgi:hypothetical protein
MKCIIFLDKKERRVMRRLIYVSAIFFTLTLISFAQLDCVQAFPNLEFEAPVDIQNAGDGSNRLFVLEQEGRIKVFQNDSLVNTTETFLDIADQVLYGGEQGLLGLAFHPNYEENGYFYIDYTTTNPRRTVISRFSVSKNNPNQADPESELILLEVEQPYSNHNGGQITFGPDGYLYISFGDGGSAGDPENNGQDRTTLLGSIIRIDVDNPQNGMNYGIPGDTVCVTFGALVLILKPVNFGRPTLDKMLTRKSTLLKAGKITVGELWKDFTAMTLLLIVTKQAWKCRFGNTHMTHLTVVILLPADLSTGAPTQVNFTGVMFTVILYPVEFGLSYPVTILTIC